MQARKYRRMIVIAIILFSIISIKSVNAQNIKLKPSDDSYINREKEDTNYAEDSFLKIRNDYGFANTSGWEWASFLKFNLSNLQNHTLIHTAHLNIYYNLSEHYESFNQTLSIYRVTSSWDENTLKYSNKPSTYSQNTTSIIVKDNTSSWIKCNVTEDILKIVNQTVENHGWMISDENHWGHFDIPEFKFYSKDSNQSNYYPYLEINVTNIKPKTDFYYNITLDEKKIDLTDNSIDPDGNITSWNWNFGDGNTSSIKNPVHNYKEYGKYNVSLTLTDNLGKTNSTKKTVLISKEEKIKKEIEEKFNITIAANFYAENMISGEVLTVEKSTCNQGKNGFVFSINNSLEKMFVWFQGNDFIELVEFLNKTQSSLSLNKKNQSLSISVNKTNLNWSYIIIQDNYENFTNLNVKRTDNTTISDCRIWRERNTIIILDDLDTNYTLIFSNKKDYSTNNSSATQKEMFFSIPLIILSIIIIFGLTSYIVYIMYIRKNLSNYVKHGNKKINEIDSFLKSIK